MRWLLMLTLLGCVSAQTAFAEEEKKPEAKKEGGKEEGSKSAAEFSKHDGAMTGFLGKINTDEKNIREMIEEKNKIKDESKAHEIVEEIKKNLKDRKDNIEKYNKEYLILRYQYPEKGKDVLTKYKKFDDKKVKEFEDEVNKSLSSSYNNVKQKYGGDANGI